MTLTFSQFGMLKAAPLIPLLPLAAAAFIGLLGPRRLKAASHWPAILALAGSLACSGILLGVVAFAPADRHDATYTLYSWITPTSGVSFDISFRIDPLTAVMLVMVCTISLLVMVYSRDYMRRGNTPERGYERFFAFMSLFVFSMAVLVLAGNFLLLYLGWEAVGLCSYLLIGFYYERPAAAAAAKKAFLVNRIGDFGFGLGILCIYLWVSPAVGWEQNPLDYAVVFHHAAAGTLSAAQCTIIALLLFCGAVGKSAQLPLYVWLPDAMEGPSPVSALIHAATMVTAGVYMVVRCGAIYARSDVAMTIVAVVGAATALYAATIALAQYDMKRILAYSTISQLGYMFLGVGCMAADSAIFHLFTHAFFKALLFLAAGSVMHAMGGLIDIRALGGLRRRLPVTYVTFVIGGLALAGFPLLSGFFSKDEIIHAAFERAPILGIIGLVTAMLTAFYTFRMVFLAFAGEERFPGTVHPHEAGGWMLAPLGILALGAIAAGCIGLPANHGLIHRFLAGTVAPYAAKAAPAHEGAAALLFISAAVSILGIILAWWLHVLRPHWSETIRTNLAGCYRLLHNKYFIDELNDAAIVRPLRYAGRLLFGIDRLVVDGFVLAVAFIPQAVGFLLRAAQRGSMQGYGVAMTAGLAVIVLVAWLVRL